MSLRSAILLALLLATASVAAFELLVGSGEVAGEFPLMPPGDWRPVRGWNGSPGDASSEERARFLSLPYLGGRTPAASENRTGVVHHLPERARKGLNLYTSGHGPEVVLMGMAGKVLHRWRYAFEEAFPDVVPTWDTQFFRRAHLFPDGRLLALYQTGGLVFLDWHSRLLGRCRGNFYNDFWVGDDGRIWALGKEAQRGAGGQERLEDYLVLLRYRGRGDGCREVRRISITEAFLESAFADLLDPMAPAGDVLHTNAVTELEGDLARISSVFARGNLLVSIRQLDLVAVVAPDSERVVWAQRGPWKRQHDPSLLDDGGILLFDNRGYEGFSRLVEVQPFTQELDWVWVGRPPASFSSPVGGACSRLPGGNTLVTESVRGRAFELDASGRVVWEFRSPHRAGRGGSLVAMLFEVQRLPPEYLEPSVRPAPA